MMEEACINDCQRGQAHGMGFCTTFGAASAPVVLGYSEAIETSDRNIYLTMLCKLTKKSFQKRVLKNCLIVFNMLLVKSLEGILWAASAYCGSEAGLLTCDYCGAGVEFLDVLEAQNKTMENLEAVKEVVKNFDREVINISVTASKYFELGDGIRDVLKYDELLQQTDELLYW
jgi:hypothetical protein